MKRRAALLTLFTVVGTAAIGVACANSSDSGGASPDPGADGSILPSDSVDASADGESPDASSDARADVDAAIPPCTSDGWCKVSLPDARPYGMSPFRITGIAMNGTEVWATTTAIPFGGGSNQAHLLQYDGATWVPKFGMGISQTDPFPYDLNAIASDGQGGFVAVGGAPWGGAGTVILRIKGGKIDVETPTNIAGGAFVSVAFPSPGKAWALDYQGFVYRNDIAGDGTSTWTLVPGPHMPDPNTFSHGPNTLFATSDGIGVAGLVNGTWGPDGFIPGYAYFDRRGEGDDGVWRTSKLPSDNVFSVNAGVQAAPSKLWLGASNLLIGSTPDPTAVDNGELAWAPIPKPLPTEPHALWARSASDVYAVAQVGRIYHYDGSTWEDAKLAVNGAPFTTNELKAITGLPTGEIWIGGTDVAIHFVPKTEAP